MLKKIVLAVIVSSSLPSTAATLWESDDTLRNVNVIGFGHVDIAQFNSPPEEQNTQIDDGFQDARVALHLSSRLSSRVTTFFEAELTVTEDNTIDSLERWVVKYDIDNNSQISAGRYHAPVGYWNQHYHHGRWLQISKDRPVQSDFGLGFLPAHYIGVMYERKIRTESLTVDLDIGLGEGRDADLKIPDFSGPVTVKGKEAFVAQVNITPNKNRKLNYGGSTWVGDLKDSDGSVFEEQVFTAHFRYAGSVGDFLAEVSTVKHDYQSGRENTSSYGAYLQYSHRLNVLEGRLRPYIRLDYLDIDEKDYVFSGLQSKQRQTLGIRYDVTDNSAIKFEVRHDDLKDDDLSIESIHGQFSAFF
ncbi:MAG: hypothetical protein ACI854_002347 [Arenicella sp.]|jgi:hypothetical protein